MAVVPVNTVIGLLTVPVKVGEAIGALALSCVWMAEVTPLKCPSSALVTALTATFPFSSETNPLLAVRLVVAMVVTPPVRTACFSLSNSVKAV